ncbi:YgfZ/GcvT domain-containing protein [Alteromonas ponticola]|uniref:Folate-binding protein YgfZ n=1 Tax=Alteromonas ponticola TaxID=2720613 RepID=A0ABX1QYM0_9ALTE|nr:folate-binding protein YgfZ [Alteromonas ponticola]NMH58944.1 folate-binding protein YgfZ [Alteromonas ponticola]
MTQCDLTQLASLDELADEFSIELTQLGMISVSGEQRNDFLHSQLTIDLKQFSAGKGRFSAHCDAKGKTWSVMHVTRYGERVMLSLAASALAASLTELKKYGVFSKVAIEDVSQSFTQFAARGESVNAFTATHFGLVPTEEGQVIENELGMVMRVARFSDLLHFSLTEAGREQWMQFANESKLACYPPAVYDALAVQHGIPWVTEENISQFVPQMINLQALDAIDFKKGCYMGQEVIARTRYLGKNKRAAMIFKLDGSHKVNPADPIELQLGENWRKGGVVVRSAALPDETWLLAVVANDTEHTAKFRLNANANITFSPQALPYPITDDSDKMVKR